jgi:hypothetical protein
MARGNDPSDGRAIEFLDYKIGGLSQKGGV